MMNTVGHCSAAGSNNHGGNPRRRLRTTVLVGLTAFFIISECDGGMPPKELSLIATNGGNHTTAEVEERTSDDARKMRHSERKKNVSNKKRTSSSKRQGMLRIQREWKDAIQAGIAFDWGKGEPRGKASASSSSHVWIGPVGSSLFLWHFTVTGVPGSAFEHGVYHGRIVLPSDYPSTPPRIMMLTPSGRFIPGHDICLSASQYHPETWQPNVWSIRTLVESLRLHMCTAANEVGGIHDSFEQRVVYAKESRHWTYHVLFKNQTMRIDHGHMLEKGFVFNSNAKERCSTRKNESLMENDAVGTLCNDEREVETVMEPYDSSIIQYTSRRRKSAKRTSHHQVFLQVVRQMITSPLRMSILTLCLLFFYLNF